MLLALYEGGQSSLDVGSGEADLNRAVCTFPAGLPGAEDGQRVPEQHQGVPEGLLRLFPSGDV